MCGGASPRREANSGGEAAPHGSLRFVIERDPGLLIHHERANEAVRPPTLRYVDTDRKYARNATLQVGYVCRRSLQLRRPVLPGLLFQPSHAINGDVVAGARGRHADNFANLADL